MPKQEETRKCGVRMMYSTNRVSSFTEVRYPLKLSQLGRIGRPMRFMRRTQRTESTKTRNRNKRKVKFYEK